MLQGALLSRRASDFVAELSVMALAFVLFAKFSVVLLVPLGLALLAIPLALFAWLPTSKAGFGFATSVTVVAALTELWAYFLFQVVHEVHFGHILSCFPS